MNKKKKSTNLSPYPDEAIERLARAFYPAILACWNSEEGQREFAVWQAEQAHIATKEKQEVPVGELPALLIVCGFLQGASGRAHPVFAFSPLIRDFQCILDPGAVDGNFSPIPEQQLHTAGVHVKMTGSCIVLHNRVLLKSLSGLYRSIYDFGFHLLPGTSIEISEENK